MDCYHDEGLAGLANNHISQISHCKAPLDEVARLEALYRGRKDSWNVTPFHWHRRQHHDGQRSYNRIRN
jgi:hypothetical protein